MPMATAVSAPWTSWPTRRATLSRSRPDSSRWLILTLGERDRRPVHEATRSDLMQCHRYLDQRLRSVGSASRSGQSVVNAAAAGYNAQVAAADGNNVAAVQREGSRRSIPTPQSPVDQTPAAQRFGAAAEQTERTRAQQDLWTNRAFGAAAAAEQYANDSTGIGAALNVAFLGGAGRDRFRDRAELLESLAVDQAAAGDPRLQAALVDVGRSSGVISKDNEVTIEQALRRGFSRTWNSSPSSTGASTANPDTVMYP